MAEPKDDTGLGFGVYGRPDRPRVTAGEIAALLLSGGWLVGAGLYLLRGGPMAADRLEGVLILMTLVLPVALVWVVVAVARTARMAREDAAQLRATVDALRQAHVAHAQGGGVKPAIEKKIDSLVAAQRSTEVVLATFVSRRDPPGSRPPAAVPATTSAAMPDPQPSLALPSTPRPDPLTTADLIHALNFPEDANDREGFRALRRAMADHETSRLLRASQDVLTLLSQDGIYMDDLAPDRARPEVWRQFAGGERGRAVAALGGVRDRSSLALTSARMRQDVIFRDAVHHFLRHFDRQFAAFAPQASDQDISDLAETRTARAFMLLGRVTGIFD
jgi:hypothetical protein